MVLLFGIYSQVTKSPPLEEVRQEEEVDYEALKMDFKNIFTNSVITDGKSEDYNNVVITKYDIKNKDGLYDVDVKIPKINIESSIIDEVNNKIEKIYVEKLKNIIQDTATNTIYGINYVAYVNEDILSLVIKTGLKEYADKPQRVVLQTFNYDIKGDKLLSFEDIMNRKSLNKEEIQSKIDREIKKSAEENNIPGMYQIEPEQDMYKIENVVEFFIGKNGYIYILYPYGNRNNTDMVDIIIL